MVALIFVSLARVERLLDFVWFGCSVVHDDLLKNEVGGMSTHHSHGQPKEFPPLAPGLYQYVKRVKQTEPTQSKGDL